MAFKKRILVLALGLAVTSVHAEDAPPPTANSTGGNALDIIAANTTAILQRVDNIPNYIATMLELAANLKKNDAPDANDPTAYNFITATQSKFNGVGNAIYQDATTQLNGMPALNADLLGSDATTATLPNANDLVYSTLLGIPFFSPDPREDPRHPGSINAPYNFLKNAAGMNVKHVMPMFNWRGKPDDLAKYSNYYNTITSIESFGTYALSSQYADFVNGNTLNRTQLELVTTATSQDWLSHIAQEEVGRVLRHILLFESQSYVLLTELVQTQKQLLAAQVMNNTLVILNNQMNESYMLSKAKGEQPKG